jgi:hypothetical protein
MTPAFAITQVEGLIDLEKRIGTQVGAKRYFHRQTLRPHRPTRYKDMLSISGLTR